MSDTDKPLAGVVLSQRSDNPNIIGTYIPPTTSGIDKARQLKAKLDQAGVPNHFIFQNTARSTQRDGSEKVNDIKNTPCGVEIEGPPSMLADFVHKGGMYVGNDTLKGIAFETRPGLDSGLTYRGKDLDKLRQGCETQGIRFSLEGGALMIHDPISIEAVALSGGTFNGSNRYLQQEHKKS